MHAAPDARRTAHPHSESTARASDSPRDQHPVRRDGPFDLDERPMRPDVRARLEHHSKPAAAGNLKARSPRLGAGRRRLAAAPAPPRPDPARLRENSTRMIGGYDRLTRKCPWKKKSSRASPRPVDSTPASRRRPLREGASAAGAAESRSSPSLGLVYFQARRRQARDVSTRLCPIPNSSRGRRERDPHAIRPALSRTIQTGPRSCAVRVALDGVVARGPLVHAVPLASSGIARP